MKICHITTFYPPIIFGGAEIYVKRIAEKQSEFDDVIVITLNDKITQKVEVINNVKIYRVHPYNIYPLPKTNEKKIINKFIWNIIDIININSYTIIKKILLNERPDVVHIHHFKGLNLSFKAAKDLNIPTVYTVHNYYTCCPIEHLFRESKKSVCLKPRISCLIYRMLNKVKCTPDIVTAPTNFVLKILRNLGFFNDIPLIKVPLGIDLKGKPNHQRKRKKEILFVGRITYFKGLEILLKAIEDINNIKLNVVGCGALKSAQKSVVYHGFIPEQKLEELYRHCSVLVVPSIWYEVFGLVILEAFSHGLPVIGSNIGGIPELVIDGYNGYLFNPGDSIDLREKLSKFLENEYKIKKMSKNAYETAKKYSLDKHIKKLYKIYYGIL